MAEDSFLRGMLMLRPVVSAKKMQPQRLWCSKPEGICQRVQMANNPLDHMGNPWFQSDRGGDLTGRRLCIFRVRRRDWRERKDGK